MNKSYNFNIKLNYDFKTWKNQAIITLVMVHVIVIAPSIIILVQFMTNENFPWSASIHPNHLMMKSLFPCPNYKELKKASLSFMYFVVTKPLISLDTIRGVSIPFLLTLFQLSIENFLC
jgi:hypothetical protein